MRGARASPFAVDAAEAGIMFEGGKMDDITVIVGNVVVRDGRRRRTSSPTRSRSEGSVQTLAFVTRRSGVVAGSSLCVLSLVVLPLRTSIPVCEQRRCSKIVIYCPVSLIQNIDHCLSAFVR